MSFYEDARELFGLSRAEASDLLGELREDGFSRGDSLYDDDWAGVASDMLTDFYMEYDDEPLDDNWLWGIDDWVDAFEEYEFTIQYKED